MSTLSGANWVSQTFRPPERAYLMHYSFFIARNGLNPLLVPAMVDVDIDWIHRDTKGHMDLIASKPCRAPALMPSWRQWGADTVCTSWRRIRPIGHLMAIEAKQIKNLTGWQLIWKQENRTGRAPLLPFPPASQHGQAKKLKH